MISSKGLGLVLIAGATLLPCTVRAQPTEGGDGWNVTAGLGVLAHPEYPGSDDVDVMPAPFLSASKGRWLIGGAPGTGLPFGVAAHLVQTPRWKAGVALGGSFTKARDESDDARLAGLGDIDGTARAAAFASFTERWFTVRGSVSTDIGGQDQGTQAMLDLEGRLPVSSQLVLSAGPGITWADSTHQQTFFGIDAQQSARSGRATYSPGGGVQSLRLSFGADYRITAQWGLGARAVLSSLRNGAADSPITQDTRQDTVGVFVTYRC